jgi:tetratricopeptide (TPR) repeat protein
VRSCDVYLGILGTRYGSPVRDKPDVSYTELEFDTATDGGLDRLVFLLDTEVGDVGIPLSRLIDREYGQRQDDFRRRVQDSKLTTRSFASPDTLQLLVERSLRELGDTRRRIGSGIQREQVPAEPQPVRASKFVNPPPGGGAGLVPGSSGRIPGADGDAAAVAVGGIVYLSRNGVHKVDYPTLIANQAAAMLRQAVSIADTIGAIEPALEARSWLAWAHLQLGDAAAALAATTVERQLTFPPEEPAMHMFKGLALLELDRLDESVQAFTEALAAADGLLALADRNVAALGAGRWR